MKEKSLKLFGFKMASVIGLGAFAVLAFRMEAGDLVTLCQFFFGYQGIVTGGFFGFRFGEQWAKSRNDVS